VCAFGFWFVSGVLEFRARAATTSAAFPRGAGAFPRHAGKLLDGPTESANGLARGRTRCSLQLPNGALAWTLSNSDRYLAQAGKENGTN